MCRYLIVPVVLALGLAAAGAGPAAASKSSPKPTPTPTPSPTFPYTMTDLGSLGYGVTYGLAINANGQVTGYSYSSQEFQVTCPPQKYGQPKQCFEHPYHAFLYSNGTMTDLGTLGGHFSKGYAINASGEIVGQADTKTVGDSFLWNGTSMADIGFWDARGINDSGEIAGICGNDPGEHACAYNNGTLTQLPLSVVGFDDVAAASLVTPALTTVRQPLEDMGRAAVSLLYRLIEERPIEALRIEVNTRLVVRASTVAQG